MNGKIRLALIGGICALMIAMGIGRFAYTPILPLMQADLRFSDTEAGYLASSNYAGYFIGAMLAGVLPLKRRRVFHLRFSLLVSIATTGAMGCIHSYIPMLTVRFLSGLASAFIFVLASSLVLDRLAAAGKTNLAGWFYSGVGLGIFLSTLFIPDLNRWFGWEGTWIGLSALSGILAVFAWRWVTDSPDEPEKRNDPATVPPGPPTGWFPWFVLAYGLEGLGYIVTGTFIVSIAERTPSFGIEPATVWLVVGAGAAPSCVIWSTLAKKQGFVTSLVWAMMLQAAGIALPVFRLSAPGLFLSALLFGATFMGITTLSASLGRQMSPLNSSRIIGWMTAVYAAGQMAGPAIAGVLMSRTQSFHPALLGAAGAVFAGGLLFASGIRFERSPGRGGRERPGRPAP